MGIVSWIAAGLAAFVVARILPQMRSASWIGELTVAATAAMTAGVAATAFDFGGWAVLDWRAGSFSFLTAFAVLGLLRLARDVGRKSA